MPTVTHHEVAIKLFNQHDSNLMPADRDLVDKTAQSVIKSNVSVATWMQIAEDALAFGEELFKLINAPKDTEKGVELQDSVDKAKAKQDKENEDKDLSEEDLAKQKEARWDKAKKDEPIDDEDGGDGSIDQGASA